MEPYNSDDTAYIQATVPADLKRRIKVLAAQRGVTMADLYIRLLEVGLAHEEATTNNDNGAFSEEEAVGT